MISAGIGAERIGGTPPEVNTSDDGVKPAAESAEGISATGDQYVPPDHKLFHFFNAASSASRLGDRYFELINIYTELAHRFSSLEVLYIQKMRSFLTAAGDVLENFPLIKIAATGDYLIPGEVKTIVTPDPGKSLEIQAGEDTYVMSRGSDNIILVILPDQHSKAFIVNGTKTTLGLFSAALTSDGKHIELWINPEVLPESIQSITQSLLNLHAELKRTYVNTTESATRLGELAKIVDAQLEKIKTGGLASSSKDPSGAAPAVPGASTPSTATTLPPAAPAGDRATSAFSYEITYETTSADNNYPYDYPDETLEIDGDAGYVETYIDADDLWASGTAFYTIGGIAATVPINLFSTLR